jgi:hypothetical protein
MIEVRSLDTCPLTSASIALGRSEARVVLLICRRLPSSPGPYLR